MYNDSKIRYATRVNFDVACKMEFQNYPVDEQICEIKMESFGYTNKQMKFSWMKGKFNILKIFCNFFLAFNGNAIRLRSRNPSTSIAQVASRHLRYCSA